jgi:hypothetical protein
MPRRIGFREHKKDGNRAGTAGSRRTVQSGTNERTGVSGADGTSVKDVGSAGDVGIGGRRDTGGREGQQSGTAEEPLALKQTQEELFWVGGEPLFGMSNQTVT